MRIISEAEARRLVDASDAFTVVERGFADVARGDAMLFAPVAGRGTNPATRFGVKAGIDVARRCPGIKVGSYWPDNRARGLPAHGSTTLLLDDDTGFPTALVAATHLNALRTAAADAVGVDHLARADATILAIVGAGNQAWFDLMAIRRVRAIREVRVWNRTMAAAEQFAARARETGIAAIATDIRSAVRDADIVVTATAARAPLVQSGWIAPGTHISAMGADGPGKQELDPALVAVAARFADLPAQAAVIGECQHAVAAGLIDAGSITAIGAVIDGQAPGRVDPAAITLFDSSGIAIQDLAIARLAVERAAASGAGLSVDFAPR